MFRIELEDLSFSYQDNGVSYDVLNAVNLSIKDGEFVCIVGHSGCGKTTLLNILAGLLSPTSGSAKIGGKLVEGPGIDRAIVFQHYSLFPWLTAVKNVMFGIGQVKKSLSKQELHELAIHQLERVGMAEHPNKYPFQLSGGMQQRVAIARALGIEASTLLLDEPFGALDAITRETLQSWLVDLWSDDSKKMTVVFVTHDIEEAILLADRIIVMRPHHIEAEFLVNLERPRTKDVLYANKDFHELKKRILDLIRAEGSGLELDSGSGSGSGSDANTSSGSAGAALAEGAEDWR